MRLVAAQAGDSTATVLGRIQLQGREVFGEQGRFLCDLLHVSEHLGAAAIAA